MACFEDNVLDWIGCTGLLDGVERVLLAVSGGADSTVLAQVLSRLAAQGRLGCGLIIGHVHHGLRGPDADADEAFVRELAERLGRGFMTRRVDVRATAAGHNLSLETAGRLLRLRTLAGMAREAGCEAIATAHHGDDQAETLIHRLMRGTGFRGLCGIKPISVVHGGRFVRPLLAVRRADIIQYAQTNAIQWRQDASNRSLAVTRNRIRHRLLRVLQTDTGEIVERLCDLAAAGREYLDRVEEPAEAVFDREHLDAEQGSYVIAADMLRGCRPWVFYEVIRRVLVKLGIGLRAYNKEHFDAIGQMLENAGGKGDFPGGARVSVQHARITFSIRRGDSGGGNLPPCERIVPIDEPVPFGPWTIHARLLAREHTDCERFLKAKDRFVERFDADRVVGPVRIRSRQDGDRFWPLGTAREKKVGRFLQDAQLPAALKASVFVVADADKILWVAPVRMAESAKVTEKTRRILEIQIRR